MRNYIRLYLFALLIGGLFVAVGNSIPQISTRPDSAVNINSRSPAALIEAGKSIVQGKGGCLLCHSFQEDAGARAPRLEAIGRRAAARRDGMSAAEYLVQSIYDPDAFIVQGYPGGQMRPANKSPILLTDDEILTVVIFLLSDGGPVGAETVSAVEAARAPWRSRAATTVPISFEEFTFSEGDPVAGKSVFEDVGCSACHMAPGIAGGTSGPDLAHIASIQGTLYLFESIVAPSAVIVGGVGSPYAGPDGVSQMPDFSDILTAGQVLDLVAYLETLVTKKQRP